MAEEQKAAVVYVGGPLDGEVSTFHDGAGDRIVWPKIATPVNHVADGDAFAPPTWFTDLTYHRTARTDSAGRVVYEFRG